MTAQIQKESAAAAEMQVVITADEADANEKAAVAKGEKEECEALLAEAIPALNSALKVFGRGCANLPTNLSSNLSAKNGCDNDCALVHLFRSCWTRDAFTNA